MSEETVKVAALVEKLAGWVEQQPEYPYLFLADRGRRKRAATIVAKRLLLIPAIAPDPKGADRATVRRQEAAIKKVVGGFKTQMSAKQQRMERDAVKAKRRYASLSIERAHELALRVNAGLDRQLAEQAAAVAEMERLIAEGENYQGEEFEYAEEVQEGDTDVESDVDAP